MSTDPRDTDVAVRDGVPWREYTPHYLLFFLMGVEIYSIAPLLPTIQAELGGTTAKAGLVAAAYVVVYAVAGPVCGFLSDRTVRRRSILLGAVVFATGNLLCALAPTLDLLIAARAVTGLGAAIVAPATWAYLAERSSDQARGRTVSAGAGVYALGQVLGVPVGTFAASIVGWQWSFAGIGILVLATVPLLRARTVVLPPPGATDLRTMLKPWANGRIVTALMATFTLQAARLGTYTYIGVLYSQRFGLSLRELGSLGILVGGATMLGALVTGQALDRMRRFRGPEHLLAAVCAAGVAVTVPLTVTASSVTVSITLLMVWSFFGAAFQSVMQTYIASIRGSQRASVIGWNNSMLNAGVTAGTLVLGALVVGGTAFWIVPLGFALAATVLALVNLVRSDSLAAAG